MTNDYRDYVFLIWLTAVFLNKLTVFLILLTAFLAIGFSRNLLICLVDSKLSCTFAEEYTNN